MGLRYGEFATAEDAARAYDRAAVILYGSRAQLNLQQPSASADGCCTTAATPTSSSSPRGSGSSSSSSTTTLRPILPRPAAFNLTFAPTQSTTSNVPVLANYMPYQVYNNPSVQQHGTMNSVGNNFVQYSLQLAQPHQYLPYPNINNKICGMETEGPTSRMTTTTPTSYDTTTNVNPSINVCQREHLQPKKEDMTSLVGSAGSNLSLVSNLPPTMVVGDSISDPTMVAGGEPSSPLWSLTNDDEYPPPSIWDYGDPSFDF
ncbi:ethylene-responsive transcription factor ABI4-like protein [Tanacetum coccineum]